MFGQGDSWIQNPQMASCPRGKNEEEGAYSQRIIMLIIIQTILYRDNFNTMLVQC